MSSTMRALTITPGVAGSLQLEQFGRPVPGDGDVLVRGVALGICGTDREIANGEYGSAPAGHERLILGHEALGRVETAPEQAGFAAGDLVVPMVRHPDPVPCPNCAAGEWDMCRNGRYTEHGIKERDGFGAEWYALAPDRLVPIPERLGGLGVLLEPTSVVAKAWEHIERIGARAVWRPRTALVTGAGPIGLLAALLGVQRGLDVHVLDRNADGPKPALVRSLGATYHTEGVKQLGLEADVVLECTGAPAVVLAVIEHNAANGIVCLTGVSAAGRERGVDLGTLNRRLVLENDVVFGSVNANRRHYEAGVQALAAADPEWLGRLITRRVPLGAGAAVIEKRDGDIKTVVTIAD